MPVMYICKLCGSEIWDKPSHPRVYCSRECHDIAQSQKIKLNCSWCDKEFTAPPSKVKAWNEHFCSQECHLKWLSVRCTNEINVPGRSKGHKAPHLTELNRKRNPLMAPEPDAAKRSKGNSRKSRKAAALMLGRELLPGEEVHHINGRKDDDRPENLMVFSSHKEHMQWHCKLADSREGGR